MLLMPNKKKIATVIVGMKKPSEHNDFVDRGDAPGGVSHPHDEEVGENDSYAYEQMASDIMSAISTKDSKKLARVLQDFFYACDESPHEEGEHVDGGESEG